MGKQSTPQPSSRIQTSTRGLITSRCEFPCGKARSNFSAEETRTPLVHRARRVPLGVPAQPWGVTKDTASGKHKHWRTASIRYQPVPPERQNAAPEAPARATPHTRAPSVDDAISSSNRSHREAGEHLTSARGRPKIAYLKAKGADTTPPTPVRQHARQHPPPQAERMVELAAKHNNGVISTRWDVTIYVGQSWPTL